MTVGALSFLSPWLLTGLAALPIIYWLLRTVPPRPRQIQFPPTRILVGLEDKDKTPDRTPWWLMLIRLLAAALVIFALADPVLNPNRQTALKGSGPVVIAVDNGWSAAAQWPERVRMIDRMIDQAETANRPIVVVGTAEPANDLARIEAPGDARTRAAALVPRPFAPDREVAASRLETALNGQSGVDIIWLSDGVDHGKAAAFADRLSALASSGLSVVSVSQDAAPVALAASVGEGGRLNVNIIRAMGGTRQGQIAALSARGERLSEARFVLGVGETSKNIKVELPLELRNQVSRVAIINERSAGGVHLLDAGARWARVGMISGSERDRDQPLLGPLYYVRRALQPFAELVEHETANLADGISQTLKRRPSMLILTDVGTLAGDTAEQVEKWVDKGGVLVRFAGPRLEKGGDDLLPVPLRTGGRTLGGALSWSTPQALANFSDDSVFAGLTAPRDVLVKRQVLADPARLGPEIAVLARLKDGTPLVTAARRGEGQVILFHVTANSKWSNLPLSGLFVEMLRRLSTLGGLNSGGGGAIVTNRPGAQIAAASQTVLAPVQVLDGFGNLSPPPPTASPIAVADFAKTRPQMAHPPGYYGPAGRPKALNVVTPETVLKPLPAPPASATIMAYEKQTSTNLKPWLLALGLALLFVDIIAVLLLQVGGVRTSTRAGSPATPAAGSAAALAGLVFASSILTFGEATAQQNNVRSGAPSSARSAPVLDPRALEATSRVTFGYVLTGDAGIDGTSRAGLTGLSRVLIARTAVEPGDPVGVNITKDEIAYYPILYWPVLSSQKELDDATLAKIDAFMKQGGMIIFDTRDYGQGIPIGFSQRGNRRSETPLQRLIGKLDIPRLEPVPQGHVLTKSFYLLDAFPGRWGGGQLWVEAGGGNTILANRKARQADGVSSILITANDFASAWALDERNLPLFPVVPGGERQREMAFRTGINIAMYALTGNYKADQVHVPALLERLGQ